MPTSFGASRSSCELVATAFDPRYAYDPLLPDADDSGVGSPDAACEWCNCLATALRRLRNSRAVLFLSAEDTILRAFAAATVTLYYIDMALDAKQLYLFASSSPPHLEYLAANAAGMALALALDYARGASTVLAPACILKEMMSMRCPLPREPTLEEITASAKRLRALRGLMAEITVVAFVETGVESATSLLVQAYALALDVEAYDSDEQFWLLASILWGILAMAWAFADWEHEDRLTRSVTTEDVKSIHLRLGRKRLIDKFAFTCVRATEVAARLGSLLTLQISIRLTEHLAEQPFFVRYLCMLGSMTVFLLIDMALAIRYGPPESWRRAPMSGMAGAGPLHFPPLLPAAGPPAAIFYAARALQVLLSYAVSVALFDFSPALMWHSLNQDGRHAGVMAAASLACTAVALVCIPAVLCTAPGDLPERVREEWAEEAGRLGIFSDDFDSKQDFEKALIRRQQERGVFPPLAAAERFVFEKYGLLAPHSHALAVAEDDEDEDEESDEDFVCCCPVESLSHEEDENQGRHEEQHQQQQQQHQQHQQHQEHQEEDQAEQQEELVPDEPPLPCPPEGITSWQEVERRDRWGGTHGPVRSWSDLGADLQSGSLNCASLALMPPGPARRTAMEATVRLLARRGLVAIHGEHASGSWTQGLVLADWQKLAALLKEVPGAAAQVRRFGPFRFSNLDDSKIEAVVPALGDMPRLQELHLLHNPAVTGRGLASIAWSSLPELRLVLIDPPLGGTGVRACSSEVLAVKRLKVSGLRDAKAWLWACRRLESLELLEGPGTSHRDFAAMLKALEGAPASTLKELSVSGLSLESSDALQLGVTLGALSRLRKLHLLKSSQIGQGWRYLINFLSQESRGLEELTLGACVRSDERALDLGDALVELPGLRHLGLKGSENVGAEGWGALSQGLLWHAGSLKVLDMSLCGLTQATVSLLVPALARMHRLEKLVFEDNRSLEAGGWGALATALLSGPAGSLRELHVGYCHLDDAKIRQLSPALTEMAALELLDLKENGQLEQEGWGALASALGRAPAGSLRKLVLFRCAPKRGGDLADASLARLTAGLGRLQALRELDVRSFGSHTQAALSEAVASDVTVLR